MNLPRLHSSVFDFFSRARRRATVRICGARVQRSYHYLKPYTLNPKPVSTRLSVYRFLTTHARRPRKKKRASRT